MTNEVTVEQLNTFFNQFRPLQNKVLAVTGEASPFDAFQYQAFFNVFGERLRRHRLNGGDINVWQIAGLKRYEVRNSAVLAWWLDPNESHGLGHFPLEAFLNGLPDDKANALKQALELKTNPKGIRVKTESLPMGDKENRIDIEIESEKALIFIEVKIDAAEGVQQLRRYQNLIAEKSAYMEKSGLEEKPESTIVYLTRGQTKELDPGVLPMSWLELSKRFLLIDTPEESRLVRSLLAQFCEHISEF